jgi:hypothetical protein
MKRVIVDNRISFLRLTINRTVSSETFSNDILQIVCADIIFSVTLTKIITLADLWVSENFRYQEEILVLVLV